MPGSNENEAYNWSRSGQSKLKSIIGNVGRGIEVEFALTRSGCQVCVIFRLKTKQKLNPSKIKITDRKKWETGLN